MALEWEVLEHASVKHLAKLAGFDYNQFRDWIAYGVQPNESSWKKVAEGLNLQADDCMKLIELRRSRNKEAKQARANLDEFLKARPGLADNASHPHLNADPSVIIYARPAQAEAACPSRKADFYQKLFTGQRDITILLADELCDRFGFNATELARAVEVRVQRHRLKQRAGLAIDQIIQERLKISAERSTLLTPQAVVPRDRRLSPAG